MRILVVEDEMQLADALSEILRRNMYTVDTAYDGISGLDNALSGVYDCMILDIMMPYLDGFEVLQTLRRYPATRNIPVIILTAKDNDDDVFVGWQAGVSCYMIKPFNPTETLSQIKRIFEAKRTDVGEGAERRYNL